MAGRDQRQGENWGYWKIKHRWNVMAIPDQRIEKKHQGEMEEIKCIGWISHVRKIIENPKSESSGEEQNYDDKDWRQIIVNKRPDQSRQGQYSIRKGQDEKQSDDPHHTVPAREGLVWTQTQNIKDVEETYAK